MNGTRKLLIAVVLLHVLMMLILAAPATDIAVVVNKEVPVDNLTFAELRKILLGDRQFWTSNVRVTLLIRAPMAHERDVVLRDILEMSEAQFRQYWIGKVFRAESSTAPKTVYTNEMAGSLLNNIPGSMTFIESTQVPKGVKVLRIDGLLPGEKGYPLH
jgi:ABC-type phosphate transport system substrate-binding protein